MSSLKKILKASGLLMVALFLSFMVHDSKASAKTVDSSKLNSDVLQSIDFDLTNGEKQEFTFINEDGEKVVYGAEPVAVENEISTFATKKIGMGRSTWKIYWYVGTVNMSYYISVNRTSSSTKITNAYDLVVNLIGYTESDRSFSYSSYKAEYSGIAKLFNSMGSVTLRLTATVSGSTLTTEARA